MKNIYLTSVTMPDGTVVEMSEQAFARYKATQAQRTTDAAMPAGNVSVIRSIADVQRLIDEAYADGGFLHTVNANAMK